ncbi:MAG: hypothetical protein LBQ55_05220, partial [Treponema sp.]|nr:hypothetical protein [Treponema sp.]
MTDLKALTAVAANILQKAKSSDRTAHITAECRVAFKNLEKKMRLIKSHWLLMPPLTPPDYALLLLPVPDQTKSPVPKPDGFPTGTVQNPGPGVVEVYPGPMKGQPPLDPRSNYGYR